MNAVCGGKSFFLMLCECTARSSSISSCKLFANIVCLDQDGVPRTNPLLATPNNVPADNRQCNGRKPHVGSYKRQCQVLPLGRCDLVRGRTIMPT